MGKVIRAKSLEDGFYWVKGMQGWTVIEKNTQSGKAIVWWLGDECEGVDTSDYPVHFKEAVKIEEPK